VYLLYTDDSILVGPNKKRKSKDTSAGESKQPKLQLAKAYAAMKGSANPDNPTSLANLLVRYWFHTRPADFCPLTFLLSLNTYSPGLEPAISNPRGSCMYNSRSTGACGKADT
jgi:hypothetical protein